MSCPICGFYVSTVPHAAEGTPYVKCIQCGLWYQPTPPPKRYEGEHELPGNQMSDRDRAINDSLAQWLASNFLPTGTCAAFDVGSKFPILSHFMRKVRPDCETFAVDGIAEVIGFGAELGVPVEQVDVETIGGEWWDARREKYDLITMVHLAEHFTDPVSTIRKIASCLKPNGYIFLRSPMHDVAGIERDLRPGWFAIHPIIYCDSAIRKMAEVLGLEITLHSIMQNAGQSDYVLRRKVQQ